MSVVINTNSAATIAANNLSVSSAMLQKSLNRLSSGSKIVNASDDAGGVAVAARLTAGARRSVAAGSGIAAAASFLQNQDSGLKTLAKMAERMNELQMLARDASLQASDKANYTLEFASLKTQYESIRTTQSHNGQTMFDGSMNLAVAINEGGTQVTLSDIDDSVTEGTGKVFNLSTAAITDGSSFASRTGPAVFGANAGTSVTINDVNVTVTANAGLATIVSEINAKSSQTRAVASVDSSGTKLVITGTTAGEALKVQGNALTLAWGFTADNSALVTTTASTATDKTKLAITDLAGARAKNGADQNVLSYYAELASATKTNFEAAVSRIMDVDVAAESTQLARWNTLVQAGTAMIAQANGSTQSVLTLLR